MIMIIIIIKSLFQEGNTLGIKLISLAALRYLQFSKQIRAYKKRHIGTDVANTPTNQAALAKKMKMQSLELSEHSHIYFPSLSLPLHTYTHIDEVNNTIYI